MNSIQFDSCFTALPIKSSRLGSGCADVLDVLDTGDAAVLHLTARQPDVFPETALSIWAEPASGTWDQKADIHQWGVDQWPSPSVWLALPRHSLPWCICIHTDSVTMREWAKSTQQSGTILSQTFVLLFFLTLFYGPAVAFAVRSKVLLILVLATTAYLRFSPNASLSIYSIYSSASRKRR